MKVEYINPFINASFSVCEMVLANTPSKGTLAMQPTTFTSHQCNIVCGVTGQVHGQVIYGMAMTTADKIASTMLGQPIKTFDQLAASAIAELGNMISGNAVSLLAEAGYICDITPPTIVLGSNVQISTLSIPAVVVPMVLAQGEVDITVGLIARK